MHHNRAFMKPIESWTMMHSGYALTWCNSIWYLIENHSYLSDCLSLFKTIEAIEKYNEEIY
jgi:hypothetical protein